MIITLLTDFGTADGYVAEMKGAILRINPFAIFVDITHEIRPYDIRQAAFVLGHAFLAFPEGTVHVAVVDPGVGTPRTGVAIRTGSGHVFVGPDNGVFSWVSLQARVRDRVALTKREFFGPRQSSTFHGRDIFGPVAAHVSLGVKVSDLGPSVKTGVTLKDLRAVRRGKRMEGQAIHDDRFGNLITNIPGEGLQQGSWDIRVDGRRVPFVRTYGLAAPGEAVAVVGSAQMLEIAVNQGSARDRFGVRPRVTVEMDSPKKQ